MIVLGSALTLAIVSNYYFLCSSYNLLILVYMCIISIKAHVKRINLKSITKTPPSKVRLIMGKNIPHTVHYLILHDLCQTSTSTYLLSFL